MGLGHWQPEAEQAGANCVPHEVGCCGSDGNAPQLNWEHCGQPARLTAPVDASDGELRLPDDSEKDEQRLGCLRAKRFLPFVFLRLAPSLLLLVLQLAVPVVLVETLELVHVSDNFNLFGSLVCLCFLQTWCARCLRSGTSRDCDLGFGLRWGLALALGLSLGLGLGISLGLDLGLGWGLVFFSTDRLFASFGF